MYKIMPVVQNTSDRGLSLLLFVLCLLFVVTETRHVKSYDAMESLRLYFLCSVKYPGTTHHPVTPPIMI